MIARFSPTLHMGVVTASMAVLATHHSVNAAPELILSSPISQIFVFEAIPVQLSVQNNGPKPILNLMDVFMGDPRGSLHIIQSNGKSTTVLRPGLRLLQEERHRHEGDLSGALLPGERQVIDLVVSADWDHMMPLFTEPGTYVLKFQYVDGAVRSESNSLRLTVASPPQSEKGAIEFLRNMETPEIIYEPGLTFVSRWAQQLPQLEQLAQMEGARIYPNYARLTLARRHVMLAEARGDAETTQAHLNASNALLEKVDPSAFALGSIVETVKRQIERLRRQDR